MGGRVREGGSLWAEPGEQRELPNRGKQVSERPEAGLGVAGVRTSQEPVTAAWCPGEQRAPGQ